LSYYLDKNGYARRVIDDRLIHRIVAYYQVYLPNRHLYPLSFSSYDIHHKNGNKLDNSPENLEPLIHDVHFGLHGYVTLDSKVSSYYRP